jgi:hypothetical protein
MAERCATCIGRRDGIGPNLTPGRVRELVEANLAAGAAPACHETTYGQDPRGEALCRWFVDTYTDRVQALQVAARLGLMKDQPLEQWQQRKDEP